MEAYNNMYKLTNEIFPKLIQEMNLPEHQILKLGINRDDPGTIKTDGEGNIISDAELAGETIRDVLIKNGDIKSEMGHFIHPIKIVQVISAGLNGENLAKIIINDKEI